MTKLLPCPFCGGEASWFENDILGGHMAVCRNPNCQAQGRLSGDKEKAARAWNRRAKADEHAEADHG